MAVAVIGDNYSVNKPIGTISMLTCTKKQLLHMLIKLAYIRNKYKKLFSGLYDSISQIMLRVLYAQSISMMCP